jgi:predicted DNA-binding transcriptional regulator YafY
MASLDGGVGFNKIPLPVINDEGFNFSSFEKIMQSILNKRYISFTYKDRSRTVAPLGLKNVAGFWYLIGQEGDSEIKVYKLIRIQSEILINKSQHQFVRPVDFDLNNYLQKDLKGKSRKAFLKIRENRVNALRYRGEVTHIEDGWDLLEIEFEDLAEFSREILWYGDDIYVQTPDDLRDNLISQLEKITNVR